MKQVWIVNIPYPGITIYKKELESGHKPSEPMQQEKQNDSSLLYNLASLTPCKQTHTSSQSQSPQNITRETMILCIPLSSPNRQTQRKRSFAPCSAGFGWFERQTTRIGFLLAIATASAATGLHVLEIQRCCARREEREEIGFLML